MVGPLSKYALINAKLRARISKILPDAVFDQLIKAPSLDAALAVLRDTPYAGLEDIYARTGDLKQAELELLKIEICLYGDVKRHLRANAAQLIDALLTQFEIDNLKNAIRVYFDRKIRQRAADTCIHYILHARIIHELPIDLILNANSLDEIAGLLESVWQHHRKLLSAAVLVTILAVSVNDLYFYLFTYTPASDLGGLNTMVAQRLADYLQDKEDLQVAFFGQPRMGYYSINTTAYLAPHIQGLDFNHLWGSPDNPTLTEDRVLFVFLPGNEDNLDLVKQDYPDGATAVEETTDGAILYWLYTTSKP